jgi:hypothetical protein
MTRVRRDKCAMVEKVAKIHCMLENSYIALLRLLRGYLVQDFDATWAQLGSLLFAGQRAEHEF